VAEAHHPAVADDQVEADRGERQDQNPGDGVDPEGLAQRSGQRRQRDQQRQRDGQDRGAPP